MSDLYPPYFPSPSAAIRYAPNSLGRMFSEQAANYYLNPNCKRVLFSFDPSLGDLVRSALYALSAEHFEEESLADGGDLSGLPLDETARLLHDLVELQQKSILLVGAEPVLLRALQEQWTKGYHPHRISVVTDSAQIVSHFDTESIYLKDLHVIGYQRQFPSPAGQMLSYIRTGSFRTSHSVIEPAIRTSDLCYFDLNAVRSSDSPGNLQKNPSGFFAEEASTISRICGMGDRMKMFAISAWNENQDPDKITSQLVAQIIWYFWEGSHLKELDQQLNREHLTQYMVDLKDLDYVIKFYKSENTGKWWFEEPLVDNSFSNQLIPCTYDEYLATAKDQIPERIMELING